LGVAARLGKVFGAAAHTIATRCNNHATIAVRCTHAIAVLCNHTNADRCNHAIAARANVGADASSNETSRGFSFEPATDCIARVFAANSVADLRAECRTNFAADATCRRLRHAPGIHGRR
jgi:hypothetical protein